MLLVAARAGGCRSCVRCSPLTGFALGATGPSRDMIVRNATPQGAAGRVYGFVYSGLDLGAHHRARSRSDSARPRAAAHGSSCAIAALLVLAIGTVLQVRRREAPPRPAAVAAD